MKRPAIHNSFRIVFLFFGICCFVFALVKLAPWIGYKRTDSVVELIESNVKGVKRMVQRVEFVRPSGTRGSVWKIPGDAKPGDHVSVLYRPDGGEGFIYSYDMFWRVPVFASIVGAASIMLGLFFRRRPGGLFRDLHENAA